MNKKLFAIMAAVFLVGQTAVAEERNALVIWAKDGTKVAYALNDSPKLTFTETDLVIKSKGIEVRYTLDDMMMFTYEDGESMSVTNLCTENHLFRLDGETLLFPALHANSTIAFYTYDGALIFKKTVRQFGKYAFPITDLDAGIYIVEVNGITHKIVKK